MIETFRVYTIEQQDRLVEFKRAEAIVKFINKHNDEIVDGVKVFLRDETTQDALLIDQGYARMLRGALNGMFSEAMDLGLKEEIIDNRKY